MLSFEYNGRRFEQWTEEAAARDGVPSDVIWAAKLADYRLQVSAECRRRIYAAASAETQMNMATATAVISAKAETDRTDDDNVVLSGVQRALTWVSDMRAAFETLSSNPEADFLSDAAWPELPAEVPPLIERF